MASSATTLLYGMVFFKNGYQRSGAYSQELRQIKWPLDYFLKAYRPEQERFYAQVSIERLLV